LQGELVLKEYDKVSLDVKPKLLEKALKKKSDLLAKARTVYLSVVDDNVGKWATAALARAGRMDECCGGAR
jgi:hypothetical protein